MACPDDEEDLAARRKGAGATKVAGDGEIALIPGGLPDTARGRRKIVAVENVKLAFDVGHVEVRRVEIPVKRQKVAGLNPLILKRGHRLEIGFRGRHGLCWQGFETLLDIGQVAQEKILVGLAVDGPDLCMAKRAGEGDRQKDTFIAARLGLIEKGAQLWR